MLVTPKGINYASKIKKKTSQIIILRTPKYLKTKQSR